MTLEELKLRKNEFLKQMSEFKSIYDRLEIYDDYLKDRFRESMTFDDFSWKIFEIGIFSWAKEFFYDFKDKLDTDREISYYIYDLEWGTKSSFFTKKDNFDIQMNGKNSFLNNEENLWEYLMFCLE